MRHAKRLDRNDELSAIAACHAWIERRYVDEKGETSKTDGRKKRAAISGRGSQRLNRTYRSVRGYTFGLGLLSTHDFCRFDSRHATTDRASETRTPDDRPRYYQECNGTSPLSRDSRVCA